MSYELRMMSPLRGLILIIHNYLSAGAALGFAAWLAKNKSKKTFFTNAKSINQKGITLYIN